MLTRKIFFHIVIQTLITFFIMLFVFLIFQVKLGNVFTASVASSTFAIFCLPATITASTRNVLGGYIVGIVMGLICYLFHHNYLYQFQQIPDQVLMDIEVAMAVGLCVFSMALFEVEHPPAVGITVGIILLNWTVNSVLITFALICGMLVMRLIFERFIVDIDDLRTNYKKAR